jgi:hypothetical protein
MTMRKTLASAALRPFAPPLTTGDLRRAALANAGPRFVQGPSKVREPVLSYAASGLLACIAGILLGRTLLRRRRA